MSVEPGAEGGAESGEAASEPAEGAAPSISTALIRFTPELAAKTRHGFDTRYAIWGAGFCLALGFGAFGLQAVRSGTAARADVYQAQADASAQVMHKLQDEVGRLKSSIDSLRTSADNSRQDESLRGLRRSVDSLKQEIEQVKASSGANLAQLSTKIDKADHDPSQKLAEIMARLDKLDHDAGAKGSESGAQRLAEVQNRIDRLEKQISSNSPTGSIPARAAAPTPVPVPVPAPPAAPTKPTSKQESALVPPADIKGVSAKPAVKEASIVPQSDVKPPMVRTPTVPNWVLREVYDGMAVVEERSGDLREIAPGEYLPGVGEVRSIERRGRSWVVLTSRGVIENDTF